MIIAGLHVKCHAVKAFLVYPNDSYLSIDGVDIILPDGTLLPEIRKGPLLTCPLFSSNPRPKFLIVDNA